MTQITSVDGIHHGDTENTEKIQEETEVNEGVREFRVARPDALGRAWFSKPHNSTPFEDSGRATQSFEFPDGLK